MCVGDLRLGRLVRTVITDIEIANPDEVLFPANQNRVGVTIFAPNDSSVQINWDVLQSQTNGFFAITTMEPLHFTLLTHGDLPTKSFVIFANIANTQITVMEYFLPDSVVAGNPPAGAPL